MTGGVVSRHVSSAARHSQHPCSSQTGRMQGSGASGCTGQTCAACLAAAAGMGSTLTCAWLPPALRRFRKRSKATSSWPCKCKVSMSHEVAAQAPCHACSLGSTAKVQTLRFTSYWPCRQRKLDLTPHCLSHSLVHAPQGCTVHLCCSRHCRLTGPLQRSSRHAL